MTIHVAPSATTLAERVQRVRSPGGVEAWLIEDHALPILSVQFGFRGGSASDPDDRAGTARMLADLLTEGVGPMDGGAYRQTLGDRAIRLSFSVWSDSVRGELKTLAHHAEAAFELLGLALLAPRLASDDVARIRGVLESEVRTDLGRPGPAARRAFFARGFAGHAYGRHSGGDLTSLQRIGRGDLTALHRRMLTGGNLRVAVVGAIGADALGAALDSAFADLPDGETPPVPATALQGLGDRLVTRLGLPQSTIQFGCPGIPRRDPDFPAAAVLTHCLGGDMSSRLFQEVREKRALCYSVRTSLQVTDGACTLVGTTATRNERAEETLGVIASEMVRLARDGISDAEIARTTGYLLGASKLRLDTTSAIAGLLLGLQLDGCEPDWLEVRDQRIAAMTAEDGRRVAARLLGNGELLVAMAGAPTGS
jgi:zinc protease